ncbi:MAG: hypothetical protein JJ863_11695 [Deltaproteobacteria bacterium]|nr:hypothetical protein [Deltaproteobacteria bacterium]
MSLFDYDPEGHSLVLADGRELLVHDGRTEGPRWRIEVGARLVGVGSNLLSIVSLDEVGQLTIWSHETATEVRSVALAVPATGLVHDAEGRCGAIHPGGVITLVGGDPLEHAVPGATAAAFAADGALLVGTGEGTLHRFDAQGALVGTAQVPGPVADIAYGAGFFLIANGGSVHRLDGLEVSHVTNAPEGAPVKHAAVNEDGSRIALSAGDQQVYVLEYPSRETEGHAIYGDRTINGLAFGPGDWFGVGLDGGDGNKFDLRTGATHRTDTHPGRQHNRWILMNGFGHAEPEPAPRPAQPVPAPRPTGGVVAPPEPGMPQGMKIFLAVAAVVLIVSLIAIGMS